VRRHTPPPRAPAGASPPTAPPPRSPARRPRPSRPLSHLSEQVNEGPQTQGAAHRARPSGRDHVMLGDLAGLKDVDGLGELPGLPRAASGAFVLATAVLVIITAVKP